MIRSLTVADLYGLKVVFGIPADANYPENQKCQNDRSNHAAILAAQSWCVSVRDAKSICPHTSASAINTGSALTSVAMTMLGRSLDLTTYVLSLSAVRPSVGKQLLMWITLCLSLVVVSASTAVTCSRSAIRAIAAKLCAVMGALAVSVTILRQKPARGVR